MNRKYLLLLPILFLVAGALFFRFANREIQNALLQEKYVEIVHSVDMLAAAVEANPGRLWQDHERNITDSVEYLDQLYQVYAAAYRPVDGGFTLITERFYETSPFEPFDFCEFTDAINGQDSGGIVIGYAPEGQAYRELYIYFRWMPLYSQPDERYLVIGGVSVHSVTVSVPQWVSAGQLANMGVTFALQIFCVLLYLRTESEKTGGDDDA